ncbi:MAG: VWA domain-containing protein [Desulfobulbus sp.]|nr:MAG: VWA domain-containing protein [Desulfobulbus sp.]
MRILRVLTGVLVIGLVAFTIDPACQNVTAAEKQPGEGGNPTVLILDASGSMWGQIGGKAKIVIAKEVLNELIDGLPADMQVGLSVYGHRREKDCADIEMLVPIGTLNKAALKAKIGPIKPKGKTPLSDAVRQAAAALGYTERRSSVVLVSDGLETCNADPCAVAAELARAGVDFKVHVIGFDISKEDQGRLRCLADRTGGLFLAAADAQSLRAALAETMAKVQEAPPPVVEDPGSAKVQGPPTVAAGSGFEATWEGPDSRGDFIAIAVKGSKDHEYREYAYTERGNPARLVAPGDPGPYELRYVHGHTDRVIGRAAVEVTPVQASVTPPAEAPAASEIQVAWQGPAYESDYITITKPSDPDTTYDNYTYTRSGNPVALTAPAEAGSYEVRYLLGKGNKVLARAPITIGAVSAQIQAPASVNAAAEFEVSWQGPNNHGDYLSVAKVGVPDGSYDNYAYTRNGSPAKLFAPAVAGQYEVRYIQGHGNKLLVRSPLTVAAVTASVQAPASVNAAAEFEVSWQGPNNHGDYLSVAKVGVPDGSYDNYAYTRHGSPAKLTAPAKPGEYEVRYIQGRGNKLLARSPLTVAAVTASVQAPASVNAAAKFQITWQGPNNDGDYLAIARAGAPVADYDNYSYTRHGSPATLTAPGTAGSYEVRYIMAKDTVQLATAPVTVTPVSARVTAPASVAAGSEFEVQWEGPGNEGDYLTIVKPDADAGDYGSYAYTREGSPARLQAPEDPGSYEVRYILDQDKVILSRTPLTVR